MSAAGEVAAFSLYRPRGLGTPETVLVSPKDGAAVVVALLYQTADYGLVVVTENVPDVPLDQYEQSHRALLDYNDDPMTHGKFEIVTIRQDQEALVTTSEDEAHSTIFWLEEGVEIVVNGPGLRRDDVIAIAESI